MNKFELKQSINSWRVKANDALAEYQISRDRLRIELLGFNIKIGKVAGTYYIRSLSPEGIERAKNDVGHAFNIDAMLALPSYSPMNVFAALRIYGRKRLEIKRKLSEIKKPVVQLREELKVLCKAAKELAKKDTSEMASLLVRSSMDYWEQFNDIVDSPYPGDDEDFMPQIDAVFYGGNTIKRDELLQVITLDKSLRYWDGSPKKAFAELYAQIPETIDYKAFVDLIFIEKIEHDRDSYLMNTLMTHFFKTQDQYKQETGKDMIDTFGILEEITGKPVQTYTAELDEFGDVIGVVPNKPNLKVVPNES
ncbi:hypothetical protein [Paenibacillus graminis]|uniref:hypothetical protein n=1 Tax=Paenibacillus graminis TaxID=189425 RepID=UPI002DB8BE89|nr:hypothetical protein [Paenibacillus graminis]MEC0171140.1 hypothetical protein [Paenibacillus graminis]